MSCANRINGLLQSTVVKSFLRNHGVAIISTHRNYSKSASSLGPVAVLEEKYRTNELKADPHQENVMVALQKLYETIQTYTPPAVAAKNQLFANWFSRKSVKSSIDDSIPKGLYIHGSVGGGKTTLMDLFYDCCKSVSPLKCVVNGSLWWKLICFWDFCVDPDWQEKTNSFQFFHDRCARPDSPSETRGE